MNASGALKRNYTLKVKFRLWALNCAPKETLSGVALQN
jgi:hypothetical protein